MASKVNKKFGLDITGTIDLDSLDKEHDVLFEVEGLSEPVSLDELADEFNGKEVKLSIAFTDQLG